MTLLSAHEDNQPHKILLDLDRDLVAGLRESVDRCPVDSGYYCSERVVIVQAAQFLTS